MLYLTGVMNSHLKEYYTKHDGFKKMNIGRFEIFFGCNIFNYWFKKETWIIFIDNKGGKELFEKNFISGVV